MSNQARRNSFHSSSSSVLQVGIRPAKAARVLAAVLVTTTLTANANLNAAALDVKAWAKASSAAAPSDPKISEIFLLDGGPEAEPNQNLKNELNVVAEYFSEDEFSPKLSNQKLLSLQLGGAPWGYKKGGLTLWQYDVFPSTFFLRTYRNFSKVQNGKVETLIADLKKQPWFSYNHQTKKYEFKKDGASTRIWDMIAASSVDKSTVSLYRGTTPLEAHLIEYNKAIISDQLPTQWRDQIDKDLSALIDYTREKLEVAKNYAQEQGSEVDEWKETVKNEQTKYDRQVKFRSEINAKLTQARTQSEIQTALHESLAALFKQGTYFGIFLTPDASRAAVFSKGKVLEFRYKVSDVKKLLDNGKAYVGFESMKKSETVVESAIEIAFFATSQRDDMFAMVDLLTKSFASSKDVAASGAFN